MSNIRPSEAPKTSELSVFYRVCTFSRVFATLLGKGGLSSGAEAAYEVWMESGGGVGVISFLVLKAIAGVDFAIFPRVSSLWIDRPPDDSTVS